MTAARALLVSTRRSFSNAVDVLAGTVIAALAIDSALTTKGSSAVTVAAALLFGGSLVVRRSNAVAVTVAVGVGTFVFNRTGGDPSILAEPVAIVLAYYSLGRRSADRGWSRVEIMLLATAIPLVALTPGDGSVGVVATVWVIFMVAPFATGRMIGTHGVVAARLRAETDQMAREQTVRAEQVAWEERNRIARELHDVVAHSVSVMVIQTQAARLVAGEDLEAARRAMRAVEECGRGAVTDVRRMVGVLHRGELELATPGLGQLPLLVDRARASGLPVDVCFEGSPYALSPPADLIAYRIVQEAITNAIKHAGPARALVRVEFMADALVLTITDSGCGSTSDKIPSESAGRGLVGVRERVALYGGDLSAGPQQNGGFQVRARIPLLDGLRA